MGVERFFRPKTLSLLSLLIGTLMAQNTNTYLGPTERVPGNPQFVKVQILVYDDPDPKGVKIESVTFDGSQIPLKPSDIYGFRGQASFQKKAGKYSISWVVKNSAPGWPREESHEEKLFLDPSDFWIQISVIGNDAEIS